MTDLNFNIFNVIIISGVLHGLIFSLIVLTQKKHLTSNTIFLGLVVLFLSLSNFQYWLIDTHLINNYSNLKFIYIPWHWLVLPMFYLYVHRFIGKKKINSIKKSLLIGPFFIVLFIQISLLIYKFYINPKFGIPSHFERGIYVYLEYFSFIFNLLVMYFSFKIIVAHEKDDTYALKWVRSETNWLKKLIYIGISVCICWIIAIIIITFYNLNKSYLFYPLWIGISVLVYWIGYVGLNKSKQLRDRIELRKKRIINLEKKKLVGPTISEAFNKIEYHIIQYKSYLNPNLSLKILSENLNLSEGYISQLINKKSDKNFSDYINSLRVDDARKMLVNSEYNNYTILAIGLESGFNSKSSFYTAFRKITGMTPAEYKKGVQNN